MNSEELNALFAQMCDMASELKKEILYTIGSYTENQLQDLVDIQGIGINGERIIRIDSDDTHDLVFYSDYHEYYLEDLSFEELYYIYNALS